jgi:lipoate---protein ligase
VQPPEHLPEPSAHALKLAGRHLVDADPPRVEACEAGELVVVISHSRDPEREIRLERCRRDGVSVVQRPSGGGAVVLMPGVVVLSALYEATGSLFPEPHFAHCCSAVTAALSRCGVTGVVRRGVSDLCLGDRKIAGTSLRLWRSRALFQAAILVDADVGLIGRYLAVPTRAPEYRAGRDHPDFVVTLRAAGFAATPAAVVAALHDLFG